jgi:hypothetical protein
MAAGRALSAVVIAALAALVAVVVLLGVALAVTWSRMQQLNRALTAAYQLPATAPATAQATAPVTAQPAMWPRQRVVVEAAPTAPAVFPQIGYLRAAADDGSDRDDRDRDGDALDDTDEASRFDRFDRSRLVAELPKPRRAPRNTAPLPLYARPSVARRSRWYYYTIVAGIKVPVHVEGRDCMSEIGCEELLGGELVRVPDAGTIYRVHLYKFDRS